MIDLHNIKKEYGKRSIFDKLNLDFEAGKVYALTGKSGSGKTTLLNIIAGLDDYKGKVIFQGTDLKKIPRQKFLAQHLSYLFQNFALMENATIKDNLELGLINSKQNKHKRQEALLAAMKRTNIEYLDLKQKIYELSGGEAQRVALTKAILKNAPIVLADEPTAALDPQNSKEVMDLLLGMRNEKRVIIIATHNPNIWERADEVIRLEGR